MKTNLLDYISVLLVFLFSFFVSEKALGQTTIPVSVSMDTIRACQENIITARFRGSGTNKIRINTHLLNVSNGITCGTSNGLLLEFISLKDSVGGDVAHSPVVIDTANGGLAFNVPTSDTCVLKYKIRVDCSLIQTSNVNNQIYLVHQWADSSSSINYNLNSTATDSVVNYTVIYPIIQNITNLIDSIGYREHAGLDFAFLNSGTDSAKISFQLFTDTSNYCHALTQDSLRFRINANGTSVTYVNGSFQDIFLAVDDTLIVTQYVTSITCLGNSCFPQIQFAWRCSYSDSLGTAFCDTCFGSSPASYILNDRQMPKLNITRTIPVTDQDANFSLQCVNDTSNMQLWEFLITTTGKGKLDSTVVNLDNFKGGSFSSLGLIPASTIEVDTLCTDCSVHLTTWPNTKAFCNSYVPDPVDKVQILLRAFGENDTARIRFRTFRCVEFDTSLYNDSKYYSTWMLENSYSRGVCGFLNIPPVIHPLYVRSGINAGVGSSVNLALVYTPTVTDLSVPPQQVWGDTGSFRVNLDGLFYQGFEAQLTGCSLLDSTCIPNGYLRVSIDVDSGLKVVNVDSMISFRYRDSLNQEHFYRPFYYYYNGPSSNCLPDTFRYYFNLSDSNAFRILKEGQFKFFLQACCGGQNGERKYKVRFDLFVDPTGVCDTVLFNSPGTGPPTCGSNACPWLPLSFVEGDIDIHCPGCRTPGIVVNSYRIERTSFGLQDSDNDGYADSSGIPIDRNSTWYSTNKQDLGWMNSGFGDKVEDYLVAEFSAGVPYMYNGKVGYSYAQMNQNGAWFHYLQLSRKMPHALDTMSVIPDSILLYIDSPDSASNPDSCLDCSSFQINPTAYHTQRKFKFTGAAINDVLYMDHNTNEYFYTFSSFDTIPQSGVLHNQDYIDWSSTQHPYTGFFEGQKYRLRVYYSVMDNFMLPQGYAAQPEIDQVRQMSEIENAMWFSGDSLAQNAFSTIGKNPGDTIKLHQALWLIPQDSVPVPGATAINQTFANSYAFNCENCGGIFYYYSHGVSNLSQIAKLDTCNYQINAAAISNTGANITIVYPYEYHPANLQPRSFTITVPPGYVIVNAKYRNTVYDKDGFPVTSAMVGFTPPATIGTFTIHDSLYNKSQCLLEGDIVSDSIQYYSNRQTIREYLFEITPTDCDSLKFYQDSALVFVSFEGDVGHCFIPNRSAADSSIVQHTLENIYPFGTRPNIQISPDPIVTLTSNQVCFTLNISNPYIQFPDSVKNTAAPNFYVAVPPVNWLSNWVYHSGGSTFTLNPDSLFLVDDLLAVGEIHQGDTICATITNCSKDTSIQFKAGWSCAGYPADADSGCGLLTFSYNIIRDSVLLNVMEPPNQLVPSPPVYYSLCDTLFYGRCFKSSGNGYLYPDFVRLYNIPPALGIACVNLRKDACQGTPGNVVVSLDYDTLTGTWPVTAADMLALGYPDSALHINDGISIEIGVMPDCHFSGDSLPDFDLNVTSYCGDTITRTYAFTDSLVWDSTSNCHDCFELHKVPSVESVPAGDTMSFYIYICANNASPQWVYLEEMLPANFTLTSSIPPYVITPAQGCDTVVVSGYFSIPGPCEDNFNTVQIRYLNYDSLNIYTWHPDSLIDSVCVEVGVSCVDPSTVIFLDNDSSHNYLTTYTGQSIYVEGDFLVDRSLELINCNVFTAVGAHIIVERDNLLRLDSTTISACDTMWQGITLLDQAMLKADNYSSIEDADIAVEMLESSQVAILYSKIINSVTGIKIPDSGGGVFAGALTVEASSFGLYAMSFKPDYTGQPSHGKLPYAGIDATDAVLTIGSNSESRNNFYRMNKGITGYRTSMEVTNSRFELIYPDTAYHNISDGSAVASEGDLPNGLPGYLNLLPVNIPDTTVINSYRGVYNNYSDLIVQYHTMSGLRTGIECSNNIHKQYALLTNNDLSASLYGIRMYNNAGADYCLAAENIIKITGSTAGIGISARESKYSVKANYQIDRNYLIRVIDGTAGVELLFVASPVVTCNIIEMKGGAELAKSSTGISVLGCISATITQNSVTGYTRSNTSRVGLSCQVSTSCLIGCNSVDSTGYGFHFGSSNLFTNFRGNLMKSHLEGLHLNSTAIIDTQQHAGNQWLGNYSPWFGTVNMNAASLFNLRQSLFVVDPGLGTIFNPIFPTNIINPPYVDDGGWFVPFPDSGLTYFCPDASVCYESEYVGDEDSPSLLAMIALDSILSSDYVDESRSIAQTFLYERLMRDTTLTNSNIVFQNFISNEPVLSNLYQARLRLYDCREVSDSLAVVLLSMDSTIHLLSDSLRYYINKKLGNSSVNYDTIIERYRVSLNLSRTVYASLIQQLRTEDISILSEAGFYNSLVTNADELPEINDAAINEVEIAYEGGGMENIISSRELIEGIAHQCPYQGGPAVYRARYFLSLFNDSIEYDDAAVCLEQGISRQYSPDNKKAELHLSVRPNPANNEIEVFMTGTESHDFILSITSSDGRHLYTTRLMQTQVGNKLNTSSLGPGVYYLETITDGKSVCRAKLVIVR